jgi:hypothetical protein
LEKANSKAAKRCTGVLLPVHYDSFFVSSIAAMAGETLTPQRSFDGRRFTYRDTERVFFKATISALV